MYSLAWDPKVWGYGQGEKAWVVIEIAGGSVEDREEENYKLWVSPWHQTPWQAWAGILFSSWSTGEETESLDDRKSHLPKTTPKRVCPELSHGNGSVSLHLCVYWSAHSHEHLPGGSKQCKHRRESLTWSDAKQRRIQLCLRLLFSNVGVYSWVSRCRGDTIQGSTE